MKKRILVIGGGITGLTTVYRLQKEIQSNHLDAEVVLIEGSTKLGGKIQTVRRDGFIIERGPDSFLERKTSALDLIYELELEEYLVNNATGTSFVLSEQQMHPIPEGSSMGIPTKIIPFALSGLFSPVGKVRAGMDFILPKDKRNLEDQSVGEFFRRRFGDEVVEALIEPLLSGIYAGDLDKMSLMATFPQFYDVEQKYGSVIRGLRSLKDKKNVSKTKKGIFATLNVGLSGLVEALRNEIDPKTILRGVKIERIESHEEGYVAIQTTGDKIYGDYLIVTTSHTLLPRLFPNQAFFARYKDIPATSVANVAFAFREKDIESIANGTGFLVPKKSNHIITACTWTHKKWPHTVPKGCGLLRCYIGRPGMETIVDSSDDELISLALDDLNQIMDIQAKPLFSVVSRWKEAMPQYIVGHKEGVKALREYSREHLPNVYFAGNSYEGTGLPDCISQGEKVAKEIMKELKEQSKELVFQ